MKNGPRRGEGTGATAVLARAAWFLSDGALGPYLSGSVGAGQLRHVATVPGRVDVGVAVEM